MSCYRFIAAEKAEHSVVLLCRVLSVARSAFYAWQRQQQSARARVDEQLTEQILAIHAASQCTYGVVDAVAEQPELRLAPDQRGAVAVGPVPGGQHGVDGLPRGHQLVAALHVERLELS